MSEKYLQVCWVCPIIRLPAADKAKRLLWWWGGGE
ncbi:hypothetical protein JOE11_005041, partial [Robbsia andropogonis]